MPEYLAPGVYVEEIPSGNKPIQAASTSTAGMVGMTARGPVGRPTLVTSRGAYARLFGGDLSPQLFPGGRDALPYAAEGFFVNGGARLYVVRVVGPAADESQLRLVAQRAALADAPVLASTAAREDDTVLLSDPGALAAEDTLLIVDGTASELVEIGTADPVARPVLGGGLDAGFPAGATVTVQAQTRLAGTLTEAVEARDTSLVVDDVTGVVADAVLLLADVPDQPERAELITVTAIDAASGELALAAPLRWSHGTTATLSSLADGAPASALTSPAGPSGAPVPLALEDPSGITAGAVVRLDDAAGVEELAVVTAVPELVTLTGELVHDHAPGCPVVPAVEVLTVHARWPGSWGDSLQVTVIAASLVETTTTALLAAGATSLTLGTAFGLFPGSVLRLGAGTRVEVAEVDARAGVVTLVSPPGVDVAAGSAATSQESSLLVERVEGGKVVESELHERLAMAPDHPRYAPTVVGSWDRDRDRPSDSGASQLVRLSDQGGAATRLLPLLPGVARPLAGGEDDAAGVLDDHYVGTSADDPDLRTGIQALENEPTLSLVAVPGQTSLTVQPALVAHCEKMRYRFGILDTPLESSMEQARTHRQSFDTTRAAIYYPALVVADRFGAPGDRRTVAPSGHVTGVCARTDLTRGVHKAPANEVLRGALALRTSLTKGEQDILNPIHVNCLRDFRSENRGLRVYGARVATSDPEWKYVNVRRLLLFVEQSLDTGLQWAVFEPNDKPLWDTVKQSITGFLTTVWRSGALEGRVQEEAFFVNIGYDVTMTQTDIDNGLLIAEVGVAPVKPAEFVVVRISQKTREATA